MKKELFPFAVANNTPLTERRKVPQHLAKRFNVQPPFRLLSTDDEMRVYAGWRVTR